MNRTISRFEYRLRVNHHGADHGELILHGLRPAVAAVHAELGGVSAAFRRHWLNGPHLLVGIHAPDHRTADRAWEMLRAALEGWLTTQPPNSPLDVAAFADRSRELAAAERADAGSITALRPDMTVDLVLHEVPDPQGDPGLSELRDAFKADTLDDVFALVEARLRSPAAGLLAIATRFLHLERLRWRDASNFWPMSLKSQDSTTARLAPRSLAAFQAAADKLRPSLLAAATDILRPNAGEASDSINAIWTKKLQRSYDRIVHYAESRDQAYFDRIGGEIHARYPEEFQGLRFTRSELAKGLSHRNHFAYRVLMNMLYEMFPTVGFSASNRLFVCNLIVGTLSAHYPEIMDRARTEAAHIGG